jgi:hypothetical protein
VVGVAWSGSPSDYEAFVARYGLTIPSLDDTAGQIYGRFAIPYQPAYALISADGEVETMLGSASAEIIDMMISGMLS